MNASQELSLTELITDQLTGIVLVWSRYASSTTYNDSWNYTFVPKSHVIFNNGQGVTCMLGDGSGSAQVRKYVYVSNDKISGNAINGSGTNGNQVLRYVIGV